MNSLILGPQSSNFAHLFEKVFLDWTPQVGEWSAEEMRQHLISHPDGVRALGNKSKLVSWVFFQHLPSVIEILFLYTSSGSRNLGCMSGLLNSLFLEFNDHDFWLEVRESNHAARALYIKWGFQLAGQRARYYPDGSTALLMSRPASLSLK